MSFQNDSKEEITINASISHSFFCCEVLVVDTELDPDLLDSWSSHHPVKRLRPTVQYDERGKLWETLLGTILPNAAARSDHLPAAHFESDF